MENFNKIAIENFCDYLRIQTVQPNPDYSSCCKFLQRLGKELNLDVRIIEHVKEKPIVLMTLIGDDSNLPSLLLNSHTDVVPVSDEKWTKDPFGAEIDEDGRIFARGAQDMKSVGIGYIEAIRRLKANGHRFRRTVHLSFVPDEEIGGIDGMKALIKSEFFREFKIGFALDEGIPSPNNRLLVFYGERVAWWIQITALGNAGHGSALLQGTAMEKMLKTLQRVQEFRMTQSVKLVSSDNILRDCGRITSVNITMVNGGKQVNVIPDEIVAHLDIRVAEDIGVVKMDEILKEWTDSEGVSFKYIQKSLPVGDNLMEQANQWLDPFLQVLKERHVDYDLAIFPGATDSRYLREIRVPAIGISPFRCTPLLLHDHDEFLRKDTFLEGISIYQDIIASLTK